MTPTPPPSGRTPSQRTLAAIVFTDVVGFSARMNTDEVATLKLLQRDFAEMRRLCTEHEGAVLKTTGDGLLLTFTSAVQAVACALAMQRQFAAESKDVASGAALQHRIGIHLGDVLVQDQDVMGDGVNIAARLQAEAEPGGICISQTVYDVVKNKLEMQVVSLGPRDLKNISQAIPVYRLLLAAQSLHPFEPIKSAATPPAAPSAAARHRRKLLMIIGGVAALAAVFVAGSLLRSHNQGDVTASPQTVAVVTAPAPAVPAASVPASPTAAHATEEPDLSGDPTKRKEAMQQLHTLYLDKYDFEGFVRAVREKGEAPNARPAAQQMLHAAEQLVTMKEWLDVTLRRYSKQHPLLVHDLSGDATKDSHVFIAPDHRVVFEESAAATPRDWAELKPAMVGAIIMSALHDAKQTPRDIIVGAQAFARFYALPAMTEALNSLKARRDKDPAPAAK